MRQIAVILLSVVVFCSCEKQIDLKLEDQSGDVVIEGYITDQLGPYYVRVTKSVAFTEPNQYPAITNALVTIRDNISAFDTLKYVGDGWYKTTNLQSAAGRTYSLSVLAEGSQYDAKSTMPQPVALEGLEVDSLSVLGEMRYSILPIFTDPQTLGNSYHFILSINRLINKSRSNLSDNINNGLRNTDAFPFSSDNDDEKIEIGDTVTMEMQCIDAKVYNYYVALSQISGNSRGGGVTPANPPSNISNGALGIFSANTVNRKTIIVR